MTCPGLIASGVGLSRNEASTRFSHAEDPVALEELRRRIESCLLEPGWDESWSVYDLQTLSSVEITGLVERGLMTPEFAEASGAGRGFAVYEDELASIEIGGADHIRLLAYRTGDELPLLSSLLDVLDDRLESALVYAFDPFWGYLTTRPEQSGSGLRAYATLHVPALMLTGKLAPIVVGLAKQGLATNPIWGGAGGIMQVSNSGCQGEPEYEGIQKIEKLSKEVIEKERSVRKMFMRENPLQVRDYIGRAIGLAQHAWNMPFFEAVNLLSAVDVGLKLEVAQVPQLGNETPFDLMRRLQPAHLVMEHDEAKQGGLDSPEIDRVRAQIMREVFAGAEVLS